jgi:ubiquinone/menaquinone biosynthesis C-methylase UbiE
MNNEVRKWIEEDGAKFLQRVGIKEGYYVLDFGCNEGNYAIPAAKVVGTSGKVYAFDKDSSALKTLAERAKELGLKNLELMKGETKVPLDNNSVDAALVYDVIHYEENRKIIYDEINRLLKPRGFLSLYPKHYKDDFPLMGLASLGLEDIIKEVEESGFILRKRLSENCLHYGYYNKCDVLNFVLALRT